MPTSRGYVKVNYYLELAQNLVRDAIIYLRYGECRANDPQFLH